ncbi:MAG: hypothetical protein AB2L21_05815 [Anaerolineaceae bacterium]
MENKNTKANIEKPGLEAVKLTWKDLSLTPPRFDEEGKKSNFGAGWTWGFLPFEPRISYLREFTAEKVTMNYGIAQMADTPTGLPKGLEHSLEMWPGNTTDTGYNKPGTGYPSIKYTEVKGDPDGLTDDPVTYELRAANPKLLYRFSSKHVRVIEGDFLDVTYDYMPYAMVSNKNGPFGNPYIHTHAIATGTYEGKKIKYLAGWDRMYNLDFDQAVAGGLFTGLTFAGVHRDGCREWGMVGKNGAQGIGYYCKDGEDPVVSTEVEFEANWIPLEYANDGTLLYTSATFSFCNKVIHYSAKWGARGQIYNVDMSRPGFSQTSGVWYEGSKPCDFELSYVFSENHNAFESVINAGAATK